MINHFLCLLICCLFAAFFGAAYATNPACQLAKVVGPCKGEFERYFFNSDTNRCEKFTYGGCEGNDNRFMSSVECRKACLTSANCQQPRVKGDCTDRSTRVTRYYFNKATKKCESFTYTGCGGVNRFMNLADCNRTCLSQPTFCLEPKKVGPCQATGIRRHYYNSSTKKCEPFDWGGCEANNNNFGTSADCRRVCTPETKG